MSSTTLQGQGVAHTEEAMLIGQSPAVERMSTFAHLVASPGFKDYNVLLLGESGVGKSHLAQMIHSLRRQGGSFVTVSCGGIPSELVESELFGHTKGAFTGAQNVKLGQVDLAKEGTLFLDDIAEMPFHLQAKLLHLVEKKRFHAIGEAKERAAKTRIIAATNVEPSRAISEGKLREDLFHRLDRLTFTVPPLRERLEDIELLVNHIASREKLSVAFLPDALMAMREYSWPGNVRELENVVAKAALSFFLNPGEQKGVGSEHVFKHINSTTNLQNQGQEVAILGKKGFTLTLKEAVENFERQYLVRLLRESKGNIKRAARVARVASRSTLQCKIERLGLKEFVDSLRIETLSKKRE